MHASGQRLCSPGGSMFCNLSFACRALVIPVAWWGIVGFSGDPGYRVVMDRFGLGLQPAAATIAVMLAGVTAASMLPCSIRRRLAARQRNEPSA
jgi:hypothetical protein